MGPELSRRHVLGAGVAMGVGGRASLRPGLRRVLDAATACPASGGPGPAKLTDVEHVIVMIQENRSFDHYFGSYRGVRGFADPDVLRQPDGLSVLAQPGWPPGHDPDGHLLPFHLDTATSNAECTADPTHDWGPQHRSWNDGRMDGWMTAHVAANGAADAPITMGYYNRSDLALYYALADAFTICDRYHCSAISPTDPNRLHAMSGTIDPDGRHGGPVVGPAGSVANPPLDWTTMPEQLQAKGVSWKVYSSPESTYEDTDNSLVFFKQFRRDPVLFANGLAPTYPGTFEADVLAGQLPQVSWVISPVVELEHPSAPPAYGEASVAHVLQVLTANPALWAKTVLLVTWDENGGFFDHVPPPTAPAGTPGEWITTATLPAAAEGIRGPIGLGFRVPMLVVSPFSRGGFVCSDVFDHTSTLRFIERRFGVEVPNLSAWRRSVTGDLTSALNFAAPVPSVPTLPPTSLADPTVARECVPGGVRGFFPLGPPYPVPPNRAPTQEAGAARRPSGVVADPECDPTPPSSAPGVGGAPASGSRSTLPATGDRRDPLALLGLVALGALTRARTRARPR